MQLINAVINSINTILRWCVDILKSILAPNIGIKAVIIAVIISIKSITKK